MGNETFYGDGLTNVGHTCLYWVYTSLYERKEAVQSPSEEAGERSRGRTIFQEQVLEGNGEALLTRCASLTARRMVMTTQYDGWFSKSIYQIQ